MDGYIIGNLLGRFVISYAVVWLLAWLLSRRSWRDAFRRTHHWYGMASVMALVTVGLFVSIARMSA